MGLDIKTYRLTDRQSQCDLNLTLNLVHERLKLGGGQAYDRSSD
jgi:hypothetical protein